MPITFDTSGFQAEQDGSWRDPQTNDRMALQVNDGSPFEASWMNDPAALRRGFAGMFAEAGCLIQADLVPFGGARAVWQLCKVPMPNGQSGQIFLSIFTLTKATQYAQLVFTAPETGTTGMREAMIMQRLGMPGNWVMPHPYDPDLKTRLPFHRGDDPAFDAQFPDHPLSRARRWAGRTAQTARVDPRFAALPELGTV